MGQNDPPPQPPRTTTFPVAPENDNRVVAPPHVVVPIVLVPGVMGSRLRLASGSAHVKWDPDDAAAMLTDWIQSTVPRRRDMLKNWSGTVLRRPHDASVMNDSQVHRGWGTVAWDFYGPLLRHLEAALSPERIGHEIEAPVYAVGYDWRHSNEHSGRALASEVRLILQETQATKAILVTHSMGGIVSRSACVYASGFRDKVAGIVHTVQPATGAPVAYRRFFSGAGDIPNISFFIPIGPRIILGELGWQYTATVSGALGPLQLMPTHHYAATPGSSGNMDWMHLNDSHEPITLPNPDVWANYALDHWPGVRRPWEGDISDFGRDEWEVIRNDLLRGITAAYRFHQRVGLFTHPNTFVALSNSLPSEVGTVRHPYRGGPAPTSWNWRGVGSVHGPGDGTVPESSARALHPTVNGHRVRDPQHAQPPHLLVTRGEHGDIFKTSQEMLAFVTAATQLLLTGQVLAARGS